MKKEDFDAWFQSFNDRHGITPEAIAKARRDADAQSKAATAARSAQLQRLDFAQAFEKAERRQAKAHSWGSPAAKEERDER